jgi:hypothetical protein
MSQESLPISPQAQTLIDTVKSCKGQFIRVEYRTTVKTAAAHKDVTITKHVNGVYRTGIDYANKASVKEAIENGERGEVQPLPWGQWAVFPWIIVHKGAEYVRLFPVSSVTSKPDVRYELESESWPEHNGTNISEDVVAKFLTPGDKAKLYEQDRDVPECITKKLVDVNVIGCWHNETSQEVIDSELGKFQNETSA